MKFVYILESRDSLHRSTPLRAINIAVFKPLFKFNLTLKLKLTIY